MSELREYVYLQASGKFVKKARQTHMQEEQKPNKQKKNTQVIFKGAVSWEMKPMRLLFL